MYCWRRVGSQLMANDTGTATLDFGTGSCEASAVITGEGSILATSKVEAYIMGSDSTSDHTASDHQYVRLWLALTCGTPIVATGFTIYGRSTEQLKGTFQVRWVWSD